VLEHARVPFDDHAIRALVVRRFGERRQADRVVTSPQPSHRHVENLRVEKSRDLAGTEEKSCVLLEETRPLPRILSLRSLIGDQRVDPRLAGSAQQIENKILSRHEAAAETRASLAQKPVDRFDALRLVDDVDRDVEMRAGRERQPFPVAEVGRQQNHRLLGVSTGGDQLGIFDRHAAPQRVGAGPIAPECFEQRIRKIAIRAAKNDRALIRALAGKGIGDIELGTIAPPAQHAKCDEVYDRAPRIEQR
jgi:hypothetical protein